MLALFRVVATRTALQDVVAATTTAISAAFSGVASCLWGAEMSNQVMAVMALMLCATPNIRATYGVYRALSVVALYDSLIGVAEGDADRAVFGAERRRNSGECAAARSLDRMPRRSALSKLCVRGAGRAAPADVVIDGGLLAARRRL